MDFFKEQVKRGFQACKDDISEISSQQSQLNSGLIALEEENKLLKSQLREIRELLYDLNEKISNNQLNSISEELYKPAIKQEQASSFYVSDRKTNFLQNTQSIQNNSSIQNTQSNNINHDIQNLHSKKKTIQKKNNDFLLSQQEMPKNPNEALKQFKEKINKKSILKEKIIELIGERGLFLNELKFLFVDYYKYSSKATFYSYLKEVELEKSIRIERVNNKNVVYLEVHAREELLKKNHFK